MSIDFCIIFSCIIGHGNVHRGEVIVFFRISFRVRCGARRVRTFDESMAHLYLVACGRVYCCITRQIERTTRITPSYRSTGLSIRNRDFGVRPDGLWLFSWLKGCVPRGSTLIVANQLSILSFPGILLAIFLMGVILKRGSVENYAPPWLLLNFPPAPMRPLFSLFGFSVAPLVDISTCQACPTCRAPKTKLYQRHHCRTYHTPWNELRS